MSQIATNASVESAVRAAPVSRFSDMKSEDFIKIIFTELTNQDPFQPNDSSALLEQLNSIRSIESDVQLTKQLQSIVFQNQLSSASSMIGNSVQGLTDEGERVGGQVIAVLRQGESISLQLDNGWSLPIDGVESVVNPLALQGLQGLSLGGAA
ncbi:MAG: hypothetical protein KDA22_01865 [Phycisphaerales bacterium]|nr:hypothetical protein [Phycisphaerales bacterium]